MQFMIPGNTQLILLIMVSLTEQTLGIQKIMHCGILFHLLYCSNTQLFLIPWPISVTQAIITTGHPIFMICHNIINHIILLSDTYVIIKQIILLSNNSSYYQTPHIIINTSTYYS